MWEKLSKTSVQNAIAIIIIIVCSIIAIVSTFYPIPKDNQNIVSVFYSTCLVGVIGWAFTQSKNQQPK